MKKPPVKFQNSYLPPYKIGQKYQNKYLKIEPRGLGGGGIKKCVFFLQNFCLCYLKFQIPRTCPSVVLVTVVRPTREQQQE